MKRAIIGIALLALAPLAHAKPATIWADYEMQRAWLAAEVEVLAVTPGRQWGQWQDYDIRVRVTSRPDRIFRGFRMLGEEIQVTATAAGWRACAHRMREWRRLKRRPLIIVDDRRQVRMAGLYTGTAFRLQGFFDFNAIWVRCRDAGFGTINARRTQIDVKWASIAGVHGAERRAFWGRVARFVSKEKPSLDPERIEALVERLASGDRAARVGAHQQLLAGGQLCVEQLEAAGRKLDDPEAARRLRRTLQTLRPYREAAQVARRVPKRYHGFVLKDGLPTLTGAALEHARAYRRSLMR